MNIVEWNNAIGHYFFNETKKDQQVLLHINKSTIISVGEEYMPSESREIIWQDFLTNVKRGYPGTINRHPAEWLRYAYEKKRTLSFRLHDKRFFLEYPPYLIYLVLFVLPLTESHNDESLRNNNYYDRLKDFFEKHDLFTFNQGKPATFFRELGEDDLWIKIWKDLENWTQEKHGEIGVFKAFNVSNANWKYVGLILSQTVLSPSQIKELPQLFEKGGLSVGQNYSDSIIEGLLYVHGKIIGIDFTSCSKEIRELLTTLVKSRYETWDGEVIEASENRETLKVKLLPYRISFKFSNAKGKIDWGYRVKAEGIDEENLPSFLEGKMPFDQSIWSQFIPINESYVVDGFSEEDSYLRLKVSHNPPVPSLILFQEASSLDLAGYIQVSQIKGTGKYVLLFDKTGSIRRELQEFFRNCEGGFKEIKFDGVPEGWSLVVFEGATKSLVGIPELTFPEEAEVHLKGGLKIRKGVYAYNYRPSIEIFGKEDYYKVVAEFKGAEEYELIKSASIGNNSLSLEGAGEVCFHFPEEIPKSKEFKLKAYATSGKEVSSFLWYKFEDFKVHEEIADLHMPIDRLGYVKDQDEKPYLKGLRLFYDTGNQEERKRLVQAQFAGQIHFIGVHYGFSDELNLTLEGFDKFLFYISSLGKRITVKEFFDAYAFFYNEYFKNNFQRDLGAREILMLYEQLGHINILRSKSSHGYSELIVVNTPTFIPLPKLEGQYRVCLCGARSEELLSSIKKECEVLGGVNVIEKRHPKNNQLQLLPKVITLESKNISKLTALAKRIGIFLDFDYFFQLQLMSNYVLPISSTEFLANQSQLLYDFDYPKRMFNPNKLFFEKVDDIQKNLALVEYTMTTYHKLYVLWLEGIPYAIDRDWGRYYVLSMYLKENKKDILRVSKEGLWVPSTVPLPSLLAKAMTLFSGRTPEKREFNGREYNFYFHVPETIQYNLLRFVINQIQNKYVKTLD